MIRRLIVNTILLFVFLLVGPLAGQAPGFSTSNWKRVETDHFTFLYPEELTAWTHSIAGRMDAVYSAVDSLVGFVPEDRVTVIVDDPTNVPNGAMYAGPLLYLWPTPPSPRSMSGNNRGWPEKLAVHEFAHAAHLTRPSRNPYQRLLASMVPIPVTNLMRLAPRWVIEGYATYVEGRVTGSGRPHGVWRPAVLRTWALEGQLPTYGAVSGAGGYYGGSMAYLVGSAFFEWLIESEAGNEEVLQHLWRRLTARQPRGLNGAFTGVFGAPPAELYGLFSVALAENSLAVRDAVERAGGVVDGVLFQRLTGSTGDPDVSPDGAHLAVALRSVDRPSRLVVMSTTPDTLTDEQRRHRSVIQENDPEDVEAVQRRPMSQRPLATLNAAAGRGYTKPAFLPDGENILVVRSDLVENSRSRPDLFIWNWRNGAVRRVTHGASISEAHPAPDGQWAAGLRCSAGSCDIVRIDLSTGDVTTLASGDIRRPYYHPRVSPDGRNIVASVQHDGNWRLAMMNADGTGEHFVGPADGAARFDAEFVDASTLVLSSTRGGIHNIERLDMTTDQIQPLTRTLSAAVAPTPTPEGDVFFLSLHSRGWDLRRIAAGSAPAISVVFTDPIHTPATRVPDEAGSTLQETDLAPARNYGLGPRYLMPLPLFDGSIEGWSAGVALRSTDPIGKFAWQLRGMHGSSSGWRGGSAEVLWRGFRPWFRVQGFVVEGPLTKAPGGVLFPGHGPWDDDYIGGVASFEFRHFNLGSVHRFKVGGSFGKIDSVQNRTLGFAEYGVGLIQTSGANRFTQSTRLHFSTGRTGNQSWARWRASGSVGLQVNGLGVGISGLVAGTNAPAFSDEELIVGGTESTLFDPAITSFRLAMPALEVGALRGDRVRTIRAEFDGGLPFTTFFWTGDASGDRRGWYRLAGVELERNLHEMPYLRLPAVRLHLGLARLLSNPGKGDWRAWATVTYEP